MKLPACLISTGFAEAATRISKLDTQKFYTFLGGIIGGAEIETTTFLSLPRKARLTLSAMAFGYELHRRMTEKQQRKEKF